MLRDALFLVLFCLFSVAFHLIGQERQRRNLQQRETLYYRLGSAEMLPESARRSLLEGRFQEGLRLHPEPETYRQLAELFLAQGKPSALAVTSALMGRIREGQLELFTPLGAPWTPQLYRLEKSVSQDKTPLPKLKPPFQLQAEGEWLLYRDAQRSIALRPHQETLHAYQFEGKLEVEDNRLKTPDSSWVFRQGGLEPAP